MIDFFTAYRPLFEFMILHAGYALSQYVVLRTGVFSVATAGFAAVGGYGAAILTVTYRFPPLASILIALVAGCALGLLLAVPLARLRGVYQAIATLAFVQVVLSLNFFLEGVTGGANGFNGIPKVVELHHLALAFVAVGYVILSWRSSRLGRSANVVRENEAVAASLGISAIRQQSIAFALSGAIGALFGSLEAFHGYALDPNQFGFHLVVAVLSYVVLGGRRSLWGPIAGAVILVSLPEIARPLAEYRMLIYGALLIVVIGYLPRGVVDSALHYLHHRRVGRAAQASRVSPGTSEARP
ncbi:amino acid/amide ABC transporter membrane protein 2, HAAT family [Tardiphaga sp. OK246]|uniref:branched-chain amino acid ABC transporter permease n=1 Tax=Tardiphaga sp. OK246 TaxID=1855307 RepID=UPI000B6DDBBF|nr:branched-chain amino acid ABC transporter permease [Tardiphaga sp. OK246]SNT32745.1 amino acid/amide ABC transporter membrane protein 2, HAAT family [Tardiphaga sp. OK246]